jgi:alkyl hydroperoxide reductase subunit F
MHDLIIIGGGPAAISAGIYAVRKKLKTLLLTKDWGGQLNWTNLIENYPGFESTNGPELTKKLVSHLKKYQGQDLEIKEGVGVKKVEIGSEQLVKIEADKSYQTKVLIVATGRNYKKLGIAGESEFTGKGVSYCVTCDGPLFKDKKVAVIGGGNAGLEAALDLLNYASQIYLLEFLSQLTADESLQERVKNSSQINVLTNAAVKEIKGGQLVESLVYQERSSGQHREIAVQGIFVEIGTTANSFLVKDVLELNREGEIKIDAQNRTSVKNIFAAGDVTDVSGKQIVVAAGEGAKAALSAYQYLCHR